MVLQIIDALVSVLAALGWVIAAEMLHPGGHAQEDHKLPALRVS
jgi:hypothetical protein